MTSIFSGTALVLQVHLTCSLAPSPHKVTPSPFPKQERAKKDLLNIVGAGAVTGLVYGLPRGPQITGPSMAPTPLNSPSDVL